jgi:glycosyltransferase involved in cell wall biosynthesis
MSGGRKRSAGELSPPTVSATGNAAVSVFINGRFLSQKTEGVQRAAEQLVRALDTLLARGEIDAEGWRVRVLVPRGVQRALELRKIRVEQVGRLRGHAWEQLELPWYARAGVLLSLGNAAPVLKRRHVAMLYDAAVFATPSAYSRIFSCWYRLLFAGLGRTARAVLTSSEHSARELQERARIPVRKVRVVPLGAQHLRDIDEDPSVLTRHRLENVRYVLAVGSLNVNKNFAAVLEAMSWFPAPRPPLVVAGGANPTVFGESADWPRLEGAIYVGYVTDAQLKALYSRAAVFVFPSKYEGFGFPPLEAMACGCPAVVSGIPVLREICGEAAAFFDPSDPRDIAAAIQRVLDDPDHAEDLRARGRKRVGEFSWERSAREVWRAVEAVAVEKAV